MNAVGNDYYDIDVVVKRETGELIAFLKENANMDVEHLREEIAETIEFAYDGNWENSIYDGNEIVVRLCQEDEWDQHVDRSDYDGWENIGMCVNGYVFIKNENATYNDEDEDEDDE